MGVLQSPGVTYNGGTPSGQFSAVIDTGTTLVYIPTAGAKAFYAQVPGAKAATGSGMSGFYTFPCASAGTLGTISVRFGTTDFAIDLQDFNLGILSTGSPLCVGGIIGEWPASCIFRCYFV